MDNPGLLYEINNIDIELTRLRKKVFELNKRKQLLTSKIISNMKDSGETEIFHNGKKFVLEEAIRHSRKSDKNKKQDVLFVLQEQGVERPDAEELYSKLNKVLKGTEKVVTKLTDPKPRK
jgi:uncharacterized protein YlzI (FlbEa/FlbD family)